MPDMSAGSTGVHSTLTDGTGVSALTLTKFVKDFVADFLMSAAAALTAAQIIDIGSAIQGQETATFAVVGALIRTGYRAILRWTQS